MTLLHSFSQPTYEITLQGPYIGVVLAFSAHFSRVVWRGAHASSPVQSDPGSAYACGSIPGKYASHRSNTRRRESAAWPWPPLHLSLARHARRWSAANTNSGQPLVLICQLRASLDYFRGIVRAPCVGWRRWMETALSQKMAHIGQSRLWFSAKSPEIL